MRKNLPKRPPPGMCSQDNSPLLTYRFLLSIYYKEKRPAVIRTNPPCLTFFEPCTVLNLIQKAEKPTKDTKTGRH
jgi:hypothetical protein